IICNIVELKALEQGVCHGLEQRNRCTACRRIEAGEIDAGSDIEILAEPIVERPGIGGAQCDH
ncbi:hypothetical protein, partial [Xanthomonas oryzae]|uniref:hypothetical protein n=1 Tax=Xanthomonas oryzae TaxID=347 RepID=UPI001C49E516